MNYFVTKYPQGTFSWADVYSTDIAKTKEFFTSLFGWTSEDMPTGDGRPDYTMFSLDSKHIAGGSPSFDPNMPSFWMSYITVENVEDIVDKAKALGATVTMEPMDVLNSGRMATIQDPTGAHVSLWQPKAHIGAEIVNTVGAMCWNELYTKDQKAAQKFYGDLLGWTFETDESNEGYTMIENNGRKNGGMFTLTPEMAAMPPHWMVYFTVKNLDESLAKVKELGGNVWMEEKKISIGRIATIADPTDAWVMLIEMSVTPEEWSD